MSATPSGMYDLTGWAEVTCYAADVILGEHVGLSVASTLTDPDGNYSSGVVFTEWWRRFDSGDEFPLLRSYRYGDDRPCKHYVAASATAANGGAA